MVFAVVLRTMAPGPFFEVREAQCFVLALTHASDKSNARSCTYAYMVTGIIFEKRSVPSRIQSGIVPIDNDDLSGEVNCRVVRSHLKYWA